jgi:hypothetical protein
MKKDCNVCKKQFIRTAFFILKFFFNYLLDIKGLLIFLVYMENKQIKSKKRVVDHGEVFTNEREVNAMLDLVKQETERIESRFLEPACGNGNFLDKILSRKLERVNTLYWSNFDDWLFYSILATSSVYGIELLEDNCIECRERLYKKWERLYKKWESFYKEMSRDDSSLSPPSWRGQGVVECYLDQDCIATVKYILNRNILCGDALTLKNRQGEPIIFSEWSAINTSLIKRRDFRLDELMEGKIDGKRKKGMQLTLEDNKSQWEFDPETNSYIPCPIKEYEPILFKKLHTGGNGFIRSETNEEE